MRRWHGCSRLGPEWTTVQLIKEAGYEKDTMHISNIYNKLDVKRRTQAVQKAKAMSIIK